MKILFIIRDMVTGGAGKQLALTTNALAEKGHSIFLYTYYGGELQHILNNDIQYIAQNPSPQNKLSEYILSPFHIRKQIKRIRPDVVVSWRCNAGCFTVLATIGLKVKTVFSERTDPYTETSLALKISSWICNFSDGGVFQLEKVREYYKRLYKKSTVIPNPINKNIIISNPTPYDKRLKKIVHVGRMEISQKRQDVMLNAFEIFVKQHPDYTLHFYGDGRDFNKVKLLAAEKNLLNNVIFHGDIPNITNVVQDAKMLVLTSDYEGIPNVILEAFAIGVPVVSTNCSPGGAKLLLGNNRNGLLADIGNFQEIAFLMHQIISEKHLAEKIIANGLAKLKEFSTDVIFAKWNDYLTKIEN
jgi:glycosyltransferase involved in cell wall biosynthesis